MEYISIEEANLRDSERHLKEARDSGIHAEIEECERVHKERLEFIRDIRPDLFQKYSNSLI